MPTALKGFENAAQLFRRNAGAGILDTKTARFQTQTDLALFGVMQRIAQQIAQYHAQ